MFACLKYQTGSLKWQGFLLREKLHHWNWFAKPSLRNDLSHPHSPAAMQPCSHRVRPSEVVGAWHLAQRRHGCPLLFLFAWEIAYPWFTRAQTLEKKTPTALGLCETRRVLITKGTHYCGSPQQRLIASRVGPQTWHLCPLAWLNWQTACWLAFCLHPFFLKTRKNETLILSDWLFVYCALHSLFYCHSLFLIVRRALFVAHVITSLQSLSSCSVGLSILRFVLVSLCVWVCMPGMQDPSRK